MLMKTMVIGCGRWGTFIAWYLNYVKQEVILYGRKDSKNMHQLLKNRKNEYLELPLNITLSNELGEVDRVNAIFISVNAQGLEKLCQELNQFNLSGKIVVLFMKGMEASTGRRLSEIVEAVLGRDVHICVWLGPGHVQEYVRGIPNCMVIDSEDYKIKEQLIKELSSDLIRFYYGEDLIGNEIGAATKNVIGIAAGMLDGLGYTALKGALISRGTREVSRLIEVMGGKAVSAYGLCHLGDYEATVFSKYSHNRIYGEDYVLGKEASKLAEGVETVKAVYLLAKKHNIEMPICETVYSILYENAEPKKKLFGLFERSLKKEF